MKFSPHRRRGFSILEVILALAIAGTLAAVAIPAIGGWSSERSFRVEIEQLTDLVAKAKQEAETTGEARYIWLGPPPENLRSEPGFVFSPSGGFEILRMDRKGNWKTEKPSFLKIEAGGIVSPRPLRITRGDQFFEFRFDPLTGHFVEEGFSL